MIKEVRSASADAPTQLDAMRSAKPILYTAENLRPYFEKFIADPSNELSATPKYIEDRSTASLAWQLLLSAHIAHTSANPDGDLYANLEKAFPDQHNPFLNPPSILILPIEHSGSVITIPVHSFFLPKDTSMWTAMNALQALYNQSDKHEDLKRPHPSQLYWHITPDTKLVATYTNADSFGFPDQHPPKAVTSTGNRMSVDLEVDITHPGIAEVEKRAIIRSFSPKSRVWLNPGTYTISCHFVRPEHIVEELAHKYPQLTFTPFPGKQLSVEIKSTQP